MRLHLKLAAVALALGLAACASRAPAADTSATGAALPAMTAAGTITVFEGGCFYYSSCRTSETVLRPDGTYTVTTQPPGPPGPPLPGQAPPAPTVSSGRLTAGAFAAVERVLVEQGFATMPTLMDGSDRAVWAPDFSPCILHAPWLRVARRTGAGPEREVAWNQGCRSSQMDAFGAQLRAAIGPTP